MAALIWTEFVNPKPINLGIREEQVSPISQCRCCFFGIGVLDYPTPQQNLPVSEAQIDVNC